MFFVQKKNLPKVGQIDERVVEGLDVEVASDLLQGAENLEAVGMHSRVALSEREVVVDVLVAGEGVVEDGERALDHGAVLEVVDVARVHRDVALARLGTRSVARHALAVHRLLVGRTRAHARAVVLEQVLGTVLDAGGAVRVLAGRVRHPRVRDRVVALHRRTLLLTRAFVVEISARLKSQKQKNLEQLYLKF